MLGLATFLLSAANAELKIPDTGWRVWPDVRAPWRNDKVFLPEDVRLNKLPRNTPTGGWRALDRNPGVATSLPSTVEAHFWGKLGLRPYKSEYYYEGQDEGVKNGAYQGVSWWWRTVTIPKTFAGKRVVLHLRAARQRAEIYVNQKLVGYTLMAESAYDCDVTAALHLGSSNQIAIRITNPGGRLDWDDWEQISWGGVDIHKSHGFGGLDRGLTLTAQDPIAFADAWVLNTPKPRQIRANALVKNGDTKPAAIVVRATVLDAQNQPLATSLQRIQLAAGQEQSVSFLLDCPKAALWTLQNPRLYKLRFELNPAERRDVTFGFRWFTPDGIGKNAVLRLNGDRIRIFSAISWGFWGINGLFPTPDLAVKEVAAAKRLGLNCLNFHRNVGKAEVFDAQDRLGLLRYMEPGGGGTAIGPKGKPTDDGNPRTSGERYTEEKIIRMVRDFRSHPSLILYVLQNERGHDDSDNPRVDHLLRRIHHEDPSRTIVLKSGIDPAAEVWMRPYDETIYRDGDKSAGWWDNHTVGYPDATWRDENYKGPNDHVYDSKNREEIVDWGEMGGSGVPDDHATMLRQIAQRGGTSYDQLDHREILSVYDAFLTKWGFRQAFPTASDLFRGVGNRQFEYWGNVLGAARLSDANDYLTLSGWETTAVENHSGVVDNLRNFHGNPDLISGMLRPRMPVVWPRRTSLQPGETLQYDLNLLNETPQPATGVVHTTLTDPKGHVTNLGRYAVPPAQKDLFVYPIAESLKTPPLALTGTYKLTAEWDGQRQTRDILVVATPAVKPIKIGLLSSLAGVEEDLASLKNVKTEPFQPSHRYDLLIGGGGGQGTTYSTGDDTPIANTEDPALFRTQVYGKAGSLELVVSGLPNVPAQVTLLLAETYHHNVGARRFDIRANGQTIANDLDIFAEAGGTNRALVKTFTVQPIDGSITITPGEVQADNATFAGIKVVAGTKTVTFSFLDKPYRDKSGLVWQPYRRGSKIGAAALAQLRAGTPLLVATPEDSVADGLARQLSAQGAFHYDGLVGKARAPWMGSWTFVRAHPTYAGLPVNEVMHADYGIAAGATNGLVVSGKGVEIITGYGRDHDRRLGAVDFTANLGKGRILFHCLPPANEPLRRRWLATALNFLLSPPLAAAGRKRH